VMLSTASCEYSRHVNSASPVVPLTCHSAVRGDVSSSHPCRTVSAGGDSCYQKQQCSQYNLSAVLKGCELHDS
jgi:hypothetical protein